MPQTNEDKTGLAKIAERYRIPATNILKVEAFLDALKQIKDATNRGDEETLLHFSTHGIALKAPFESWSLIALIIKLEVWKELRSLTLSGLEKAYNHPNQEKARDVVHHALAMLNQLYLHYDLQEQYVKAADFAEASGDVSLIDRLIEYLPERRTPLEFAKRDLVEKKIAIWKKKDMRVAAQELVSLLVPFRTDPGGKIEKCMFYFKSLLQVLKETAEPTLVLHAQVNINFNQSGEQETLAMLALMELGRRAHVL